MLYSYSFSNRKRDLSDIFSTVVAEEPRFISNFKRTSDAVHRKHEWLDDQLAGRSFNAACSNNVLTVSNSDAAKLKVGTLLALKDNPALFRVKETGAESIFLEVRQSNVPALSLYKKLGFEELGIRKNFYEHPVEDAIIMKVGI